MSKMKNFKEKLKKVCDFEAKSENTQLWPHSLGSLGRQSPKGGKSLRIPSKSAKWKANSEATRN
jgi:hypothetical protein